MTLIAGRRCWKLVGRGVVVLVKRQSLTWPQIALAGAGGVLIDRVAADQHRAGLIEADILDHEVAENLGSTQNRAVRARLRRAGLRQGDPDAHYEHAPDAPVSKTGFRTQIPT